MPRLKRTDLDQYDAEREAEYGPEVDAWDDDGGAFHSGYDLPAPNDDLPYDDEDYFSHAERTELERTFASYDRWR